MISWETIFDGALLSGIAAALLVFAVRRDRRLDLLAAAAVAGSLGPLLWNAILHRVEAREFFVDAPIAIMPASWQDTGSGLRADAGRRVAVCSLLCGFAAFLVDVYLY